MAEENNATGGPSGVDLIVCWRAVARRTRLIGLFTAGVFALSVLISLVLPSIYAATSSVMPPQRDSSSFSAMGSALPDGLGRFAGGILGVESPSDTWIGILKSMNVRDKLISRFDLKDVYEARTLDGARSKLASSVSLVKSKEGIISITVQDRDPELAAAIANAFIEELDRVNRGAVMNAGQRMRAFVEKRLVEARAELTRTEEALKGFQERNKAVKLDDQSRAIFEAMGSVKGEIMAKEVALKTLLSYATAENAQAQLLKSEITGLKDTLRELEEGRGLGKGAGKNIFIPTDRIPNLAFEYARLLRDMKVHETLYGLLVEQYELARIQEARDTPTIQVLDVATVPERPVKPRRLIIVVSATLAAFIFVVLAAVLLECAERLKGRPA